MNVHTKPKAGKERAGSKAATPKAAALRGSDAIAPDCTGQDFYALDRGLQQLLALYLPARLHAHMEPHFKRLGVLPADGSTSSHGSPTRMVPCCTRATGPGATRIGSSTTPPTAKWRRLPSAISSSTR